jgi:hypothetical protein
LLDGSSRWLNHPVSAALAAGFVYALAVFAVGCALGAIRILLIAPRFGAAIAVLAETPFMLVASRWVSLECMTQFRVGAPLTARMLMSSVALGTLVSAEIALAAFAFGRSPIEYVQGLWSLPGVLGLLGQIAFASFPLLQAEPRAGARPAPRT